MRGTLHKRSVWLKSWNERTVTVKSDDSKTAFLVWEGGRNTGAVPIDEHFSAVVEYGTLIVRSDGSIVACFRANEIETLQEWCLALDAARSSCLAPAEEAHCAPELEECMVKQEVRGALRYEPDCHCGATERIRAVEERLAAAEAKAAELQSRVERADSRAAAAEAAVARLQLEGMSRGVRTVSRRLSSGMSGADLTEYSTGGHAMNIYESFHWSPRSSPDAAALASAKSSTRWGQPSSVQ